MLYRDYGKTGKKVSAIGFGGMRFLKEEYKKDNAKCAELVLRAFEKGVTYFDTAPGYCDDHSEIIFGEAFKHMKYGDFYVSTKCGLWTAKTADDTRRVIEKSLRRLNVPKITFYNMWCILSMDDYKQMIKKGGIYDGVLKARDEGLVEHICCSTHMSGEDIAEIARDGRVEGITLGYNAINFAYRRAGIEACSKENLGVVVMNPLGGGQIPEHPDKFSFLKSNDTDSVALSALKFLVAQDEVTVTLPGFSTAAQLDEALLATENLPVIDNAYLEYLSGKLNREMNALCTCCAYCDECPENIPIPKLMEAYNHSLLAGGENGKPALYRLGDHWGLSGNEAKKCVECGRCEALCTQKLPIIERLNQIKSWAK